MFDGGKKRSLDTELPQEKKAVLKVPQLPHLDTSDSVSDVGSQWSWDEPEVQGLSKWSTLNNLADAPGYMARMSDEARKMPISPTLSIELEQATAQPPKMMVGHPARLPSVPLEAEGVSGEEVTNDVLNAPAPTVSATYRGTMRRYNATSNLQTWKQPDEFEDANAATFQKATTFPADGSEPTTAPSRSGIVETTFPVNPSAVITHRAINMPMPAPTPLAERTNALNPQSISVRPKRIGKDIETEFPSDSVIPLQYRHSKACPVPIVRDLESEFAASGTVVQRARTETVDHKLRDCETEFSADERAQPVVLTLNQSVKHTLQDLETEFSATPSAPVARGFTSHVKVPRTTAL